MNKFFLLILLTFLTTNIFAQSKKSAPNIVVIFCDDLGFSDLSSFGSLWNQTPELDKMALEGVRFTDFYAGAPVCTPSRASLMMGCYARRVDLDLSAQNKWVLFPVAQKGINPEEITVAEALKGGGYATAIIGKWHLGDQPEFLPLNHGFDYWFGLPYSNDMEHIERNDPPLPLMKNEKVYEQLEEHGAFEQSTITSRYTDEAIKWMEKNKETPFFLYLAHTMPHNPVAARPEFYEHTSNPKKGFGASVAEISWSTGKILEYLKKEKLDENTLVIFTSDNGGQPHWGASNGILKGRKGQIHEGGIRVPFIAWWPNKIRPATVCNAPSSVLDFFPTFTKLAGIEMNDQVIRDGLDISEYLFNPDLAQAPRPFFYWHVGYLQAIRYGDWKLNLQGTFSAEARKNIAKASYSRKITKDEVELYDLRKDPRERNNIADQHPEIVSKLRAMAEEQTSLLGEWTTKGEEVRQTIMVDKPKGLLKK